MISICLWGKFHLTGVFSLKQQCVHCLDHSLLFFFLFCLESLNQVYGSPRGKAPVIHYSHHLPALRLQRGVSCWAQRPRGVPTGQPCTYQGYRTTWPQKIQFSGFFLTSWNPNTYFLLNKYFKHTVSNQFFGLIHNVKAVFLAYFYPATGWLHTI